MLDDYNVDEQRLAEEIESIVTLFREENLVVIDE
jgi:hypothetical protein